MDTDSETEADLAVPYKEQLARAKARSAFLRLVRRGLALASLAVVLHQQAFMVRRRQKVVPLHLAVSGAVAWAGDYSAEDGDGESGRWGASGSSLRSGHASWPGAVHAASRALLTPLEYMRGGSTRAAAGQRLSAAYAKTERRLRRIVDSNSSLAAQMAAAPMPNAPVLGAYSLTGGAAAALVLPGAEGLVLLGCGGLWLGCEGMHGTPELMAVCVLAALGLYVGRSARAAPPEPRRRRRRAVPRPPRAEEEGGEDGEEQEEQEGHGHGHGHAAGRSCCDPGPRPQPRSHAHDHGHAHGGRSCCD